MFTKPGHQHYLDVAITTVRQSNNNNAHTTPLTMASRKEEAKDKKYKNKIESPPSSDKFIPCVIESGGALGKRFKTLIFSLKPPSSQAPVLANWAAASFTSFFAQALSSVSFWTHHANCYIKLAKGVENSYSPPSS